MTTMVLDKRWHTILELQQHLQTLNPGSYEAEIVEYAISLAVRRTQSQEQNLKFFRYDLIRNARFSFWRTKTRQNRLCQEVALLSSPWTEDTDLYTASELEAELRSLVSTSGKNLGQCFNNMLNGESVAATALACGVSQRSANRLRQKVRQIVRTYLDTQEFT
jgi:DNA-directed RNA polymerase specialized sigma24 family protein